jgi:hypothetical protein
MSQLSKYDQTLSDIAKEGIRTQKQKYNIAKQNKDTQGMARANENANNIRRIYGGYTGGEDGSEFNPIFSTGGKKPEYTSRYDNDINNAKKRIINKTPFYYDPQKDPRYLLYQEIYTRMGNDAYDRALSQNAIKTGGIVNTNATTSAMLAKNKYNSELAKIATDLYNDAYNEYKDDIRYEYDKMDMLRSLEQSDYSKHKDLVDDFNETSKLGYDKYRDSIDDTIDMLENERLNKKLEDEKQNNENQLEYDYAKLNAENAKWKEQAKTDKLNALARLIQSVYNKSNIGVNIQRILDLMDY